MRIKSQVSKLINEPTLTNIIENANQKTALDLLCCRIGIVQNFYADDLTADVLIVNKKTTRLNADGSQVVKDWAPIRAKVCYCNPYETFPIQQGDECLLFFSDREIESWFINGNINPIGYQRMHDEADCIAVFGLRSLPKMIQILTDALHLFYGNSDIRLKEDSTEINTQSLNIKAETSIETETETLDISAANLNITGNTTQNGSITADNINVKTAASGIFTTSDNKTITVVNGIITTIA